jgi:hypothetical protein
LYYLAADPSRYGERGALLRAFELLALDRLYKDAVAADKLAFPEGPPPEDTRPYDEILGGEARFWAAENPAALGLVERAMKEAQRRSGEHWTGFTRTGLIDVAVREWGLPQDTADKLASTCRFYYALLSIESHPSPRSGSRERFHESGRLRLAPRERDRDQPRKVAWFACYLARLGVDRVLSWKLE